MAATALDLATREALVRLTFPILAAAADSEAARRNPDGPHLRGPAEGVIHVAVTTPTLWNSGSGSAAEGLDGSWEAYVELACKRIKPLRGCAKRDT